MYYFDGTKGFLMPAMEDRLSFLIISHNLRRSNYRSTQFLTKILQLQLSRRYRRWSCLLLAAHFLRQRYPLSRWFWASPLTSFGSSTKAARTTRAFMSCVSLPEFLCERGVPRDVIEALHSPWLSLIALEEALPSARQSLTSRASANALWAISRSFEWDFERRLHYHNQLQTQPAAALSSSSSHRRQ